MDWNFLVSQVVIVITAIVSAIIVGIIAARYQKLGSLGVSQRIKDKFTTVILAMLGLLSVAIPLGATIKIVYDVYRFVIAWPNVPATRIDILVIAVWVFYFHLLLAQSVYNIRRIVKLYRADRKSLRAQIEQELEAKHRAEMAPLDDAFKKLRQKLDETKEIKPPRPPSSDS